MRRYKINVNGTPYEVELEELTGAAPAAAAPLTTGKPPAEPTQAQHHTPAAAYQTHPHG